MNKLILIFNLLFLFLLAREVKADTQYFESVCTNDQITIVNGLSKINWGSIEPDLITLKKLKQNENGFIEFSLESVDDVEIAWQEESNASVKYGFKFKSNDIATLIANGIELLDFGAITYSSIDVFKVEKCEGQICYFKNNQLLYCECLDVNAPDLINTTEIISASNAQINLTFESNTTCTIELPLLQEVVEMSSKSSSPESLKPNESIFINVYDPEGKPLRQYKSKTDNNGEAILKKELIALKSKGYKIQIRKNK